MKPGDRSWHKKPGFQGGRALRLKPGDRTKIEAEREALLERRKATGEVLDFWFQPITFRFADRTSYSPDFAVLYPDGRYVLEDVKGSKKEKKEGKATGRVIAWVEEDARVKMKLAAALNPFEFRMVWRDRATGKWFYQAFSGWSDPEDATEEPVVAPTIAPAPDLFTVTPGGAS